MGRKPIRMVVRWGLRGWQNGGVRVGFYGGSKLQVDGKGRIQVPAKYRDDLMARCQGQLTITRHPHGHLMLFPRPTWEHHREIVASWPSSAAVYKRVLLGEAEDVEIDGAGRILIPVDLRTEVRIVKEAKFIGVGAYFEIWDTASAKAAEQAGLESTPESVKEYVFGEP